jgi:hypothetical protein
MNTRSAIPSVSLRTAGTGASTKANEFGMRTMQERAYAHRGEQYLLIKSPPASGKSRALMFIALDKLNSHLPARRCRDRRHLQPVQHQSDAAGKHPPSRFFSGSP